MVHSSATEKRKTTRVFWMGTNSRIYRSLRLSKNKPLERLSRRTARRAITEAAREESGSIPISRTLDCQDGCVEHSRKKRRKASPRGYTENSVGTDLANRGFASGNSSELVTCTSARRQQLPRAKGFSFALRPTYSLRKRGLSQRW
jgi:hypothetical protein